MMRFRRFVFIPILILTAAGTSHFASAFSSGKPNLRSASGAAWSRRDPDSKTEQWLSTVNREDMLGIDQESPDRQLWLNARALEFVKYAQTPSQRRELENPADCAANDPFCGWMTDEDEFSRLFIKTEKTNKRRGPKGKWKLAQKYLSSANIEKLKSLSEREIAMAVHRFESFEPLEKISNTVLEDKSCDRAALSFLLGAKAEEFLPDDYFRQKALHLYELSAKCAEGDIKARASYRYSLLQVWADRCDLAMPYLKILTQDAQAPEFRPRALYWTANCGTRAGTSEGKAMASQAKDSLFAAYPFSLHSLLLQKGELGRVQGFLAAPDTIVRYRSQLKPELNGSVLAAEALIRSKEFGWARRVLASINLQADGAEPEFQIYLSRLYHKVGDPISKFRTLTVAFRNHPETISRAALALYYPKNNEVSPEVIRASGVNELVVMSLIRQESAFNEKARSPAGALGLMQVMPRTARLMDHSRRRHNLYDPNNNVRIGSKYFSFLLKRYDGDTELALAAYNAGPDRVDQWVRRYPVSPRALFLDLIPFRETRDYVASIARNYFWYSVLYSAPSEATAVAQENDASRKDHPEKSLTAWEISPGIVNLFKTFGT